MITKILDTVSKAFETLRPSFALFFVTLLILHFSINLYQSKFCEIMAAENLPPGDIKFNAV